MIKYISNLDEGNNSSKITIDTKAIYYNNGTYSFQGVEYIPNTTGSFYKLSTVKELFVKVKYNNLYNTDKIRRAIFNIVIVCSPANVALKLYKLTEQITNFGSNASTLHSKLQKNSTYLVDQVVVPKVINYAASSNIHQTVSFDITDLVNSYNQTEPEFIFAIVGENTNTQLNVYDPKYVNSQNGEVANAVITQECGINNLNKYDQVSFSKFDKGYINTKNGEIIHLFNTFSTLSKKIPISISISHNVNRTCASNFLPSKLKASFEYSIYAEHGSIIIEDYTGNKLAYQPMKKNLSNDYYELLGIKHLDNAGDLYYCREDGSYLYGSLGDQASLVVEKYDTNDNYIKYIAYSSNLSYEVGNMIKTQIIRIRNKVGDEIEFYWDSIFQSNSKLTSIKEGNSNLITFTYNNSSYLQDIVFVNEHKKVSISYSSNDKNITYSMYDTHNNSIELLGQIEINIMNNLKLQIGRERDSNQNTKKRVHYSYDGDKISNVVICDKESIVVDETEYTFNQDYTKLENGNNVLYYYFDKYGRVRTILDNNGIIKTTNYGEIDDGVLKGALSISEALPWTRNLLGNHSFEYVDNYGNLFSWVKTGNGEISLSGDSLYGSKCLFLKTNSGQNLTLYQETENTGLGTFVLKCKAKGISNGTLKLKVGIYDRNNAHSPTVFETSLSNITNEWKEYSCTANISSLGTDDYVRVDIYSNGDNQAFFDDLQFATKDQNVRYNLIENADLETIDVDNTPLGWTLVNNEENDVVVTQTSPEFVDIFGIKAMHFAQSDREIDGTRYQSRKMYKHINYSGNKKDKFSFGIFAKGNATINDIFRAFITFDYENIGEKTYYFDFEKGLTTWQLLSRDIMTDDDYECIEIGVEYNGPKDVYFDAFQLCKDSSFKYYNYDKRGRIIDAGDANGNCQRISYNDNLPVEITTQDGSHFEYTYLSDGKLKKITDINGNTVTYAYADNDASDNVVSVEIKHGTEIILKEFEYDSNDNLITDVDEFSNETSYSYDYLRRVKSISYPDGSVQRFNYDNLSNLIELSGYLNSSTQTVSFKNTIVHDNSIDEVNTITSLNGKQYSFSHDSNGRLLTISENNTLVHSFSYDYYIGNVQSNLITSKEYEATGDVFLFDYDNQNRLVKVYLNEHYNPIYEYEYNEMSLISAIKDNTNNKIKYYSYDLKGNLLKITNSDLVIKYEYDNLGNIQEKKSTVGSKTKIQSYDYDYEFNEYSRSGFLKRLGNNFGDDIVISDRLGKGEYGLKYSNIRVEYYNDTNLKSTLLHFDDKHKCITYDLSTINSDRTSGNSGGKYFSLVGWKSIFNFTKTIYIVFKPTGSFGSIVNLFKFKNSKVTPDEISSIDINSTGHITYTSNNASNPTITFSSGTVSLNNWNYLSFTIYYDKVSEKSYGKFVLKNNLGTYDTLSTEISEYPYNIDGITVSRQPINSSLPSNPSSSGSQIDYTLSIPLYVSLIGFSNQNFTTNQSTSIYDAWFKYYASNGAIDNNSTTYFNVDEDSFDAITLNGNAKSVRGLKPLNKMTPKDGYDVDKETCFKYDSTLMRKVFSCFEEDGFSPLIYEKTFGIQGTLSFWFKKEGSLSRNRYLLSILNNGSSKLNLYINGSTIYLACGGLTHSYSNLVNDTSWHNIRFEWSQGYMAFKFDGTAKEVVSYPFLGNDLLYFGTAGSSQNPKLYAIDGYIESILFSDTYQAYDQTQILNSRPKTIGYLQDSLGRVTSKKIVVGNSDFVTSYSYDKTRITTETFHNDDSINYTYDSMGNVEEIAYVDRSVYYEYDKLGRLTKHNHSDYVEDLMYSSNGDISRIDYDDGNEIVYGFSYDTNRKLTTVTKNNYNYRTFTYPINNFYPSEIKYYNDNGATRKQWGINWQGKRLVGLNVSGVGIVEYKYDDNGIMTYKHKPGENTYFTLEGSNVISIKKEINSGTSNTIILDFTYDSNNMLAGISYNNKEYFYVRDILGNIYGIINSSGNYIIKYDYNAYGEVTKNIIASSGDDLVVANNNPFMYKGYYYEEDLECYYLKSRFYMPSICRFISPDDHSYLDYEDLRGINLYCYCYDNPIMYHDPDGTFGWLVLLLIAAFIIDTVVETGILLISDKYSADNVFDGENVEIPNSAFFNNIIAQSIYSKYLYENVKNEDGSNFFNGDPYDLVGEWRAHNAAFWIPIGITFLGISSANPEFIGIGICLALITHDSAISTNLGPNIDAEKRFVVRLISKIYKYFNKYATFDILNWW